LVFLQQERERKKEERRKRSLNERRFLSSVVVVARRRVDGNACCGEPLFLGKVREKKKFRVLEIRVEKFVPCKN